ncbi:MAG: hypothetical protein P8166_16180 [Candidatus Thiodiazotropha sp.]
MYRHHVYRGPDFFAVLVILVVIGFGMTLAVQVAVAHRAQVVETQAVTHNPNAS